MRPGQLPPVTVEGVAPAPIPQADSSATTVIAGTEVRPGEITSVRDLTAQAPNLTVFGANDDRTPKFSIRGLRENSFGVGEPVLGMYVDDVPYFDVNSRTMPLYDVAGISDGARRAGNALRGQRRGRRDEHHHPATGQRLARLRAR